MQAFFINDSLYNLDFLRAVVLLMGLLLHVLMLFLKPEQYGMILIVTNDKMTCPNLRMI